MRPGRTPHKVLSKALDPGEVPTYPVGTRADPNYRADSFSFGKNLAPTGIIEYKTPGPLAGKILVTRYSGGDDVIVLSPDGPGGAISDSFTGIDGLTGFSDPLDLVEDTPQRQSLRCRVRLPPPRPRPAHQKRRLPPGLPPSRARNIRLLGGHQVRHRSSI